MKQFLINKNGTNNSWKTKKNWKDLRRLMNNKILKNNWINYYYKKKIINRK